MKSRSEAMDYCKNEEGRSQCVMLQRSQVRSMPKMDIGFGSYDNPKKNYVFWGWIIVSVK